MRLIDADAFREKVLGWFHDNPEESNQQDDIAASLIMEIDEMPTIAAEPVVYARWEHRPDKNEIVCAGEFGCYEPMRWLEYIKQEYFKGELPPRCPHCGAKMDADREKEAQ